MTNLKKEQGSSFDVRNAAVSFKNVGTICKNKFNIFCTSKKTIINSVNRFVANGVSVFKGRCLGMTLIWITIPGPRIAAVK